MSEHESIRALGELRDELLRVASDERSPAGAWTSPPPGQRARQRRPVLGWLGVAAGSAVAVGVVLVAIALGGHRVPARPSAQPPACTQRLLDDLAVLGRPQTAADRAFRPPAIPISGAPAQSQSNFPYVLVPGLTRLARTLPNGSRLFLATYAPTPGSLAVSLGDVVFVFAAGKRASKPTMLGQVSAPLLGSSYQLPPNRVGDVWFSVVPNHVAHVRWTFPREQLPDQPKLLHRNTGHVYPATTVTATVVGNIAAATVNPRAFFMTSGTTWLGTKGNVIKVVHYSVPDLAKEILKPSTSATSAIGGMQAIPINRQCESR